MKILVSGASGLIGSELVRTLRAEGHAASRLARPGASLAAGDIRWDPASSGTDVSAMESADAVVHLAGASIASGRWNESRKKILYSSRVEATRSLVTSLAQVKSRPRVLLSASAIGYYGHRGDEILTEASGPGSDFLARLAKDWETASLEAEKLGIRVVTVRFGVILSARGGALPRILMPFKLGLGGKLSSGKQWMSWLTLEDAVGVIRYALANRALRGAVNGVAPNPVTNAEFTRILARVLRRPAFFPAPTFALRLALGEMADALLLSSQRVVPQRLKELGYSFRHPDLEAALRSVLNV